MRRKKNTCIRTNRFVCVLEREEATRTKEATRASTGKHVSTKTMKFNTDICIYEWFKTTDETFYKRFIISNSACATLLLRKRNMSNVGGTVFSRRNRFFFLLRRTMHADLFISSYAMWKTRRRPDTDTHRRSSSVRSYVVDKRRAPSGFTKNHNVLFGIIEIN